MDDADPFADHDTMQLEGALTLLSVHDRDDAARVALGAVKKLLADYVPGR